MCWLHMSNNSCMEYKKKSILLPARLRPGDKIGIAAPASHFDADKFNKGISVIKSMGYQTHIPDELFKKNGYLAGSDKHRAGLINKLFSDKAIKAIICARGGFGSIKTLALLDVEIIRKNPKIFVGFSDISALLIALYEKCGLVTFHGPMITTLKNATQSTKEAMFKILSSDIQPEITSEKSIIIKQGLASGPVIGGNLVTINHLVGTRFEPCLQGHILVLEERGEASYRIDRMLTQMKLAGCFHGLGGLVLGSFIDCGKPDEIFEIVNEIFDDMNLPILAGFEIGHGVNNVTIPMGIEATLDTDKEMLSFHKPLTMDAKAS